MVLVLTFVFLPMDVEAAGTVSEEVGSGNAMQLIQDLGIFEGEAVLSTTSTGICHCGGTREETVYLRVDLAYCPEHGTSCRNYYIYYKQTYSYCTNPYCGDNWFSDWEAYYSEHDYG